MFQTARCKRPYCKLLYFSCCSARCYVCVCVGVDVYICVYISFRVIFRVDAHVSVHVFVSVHVLVSVSVNVRFSVKFDARVSVRVTANTNVSFSVSVSVNVRAFVSASLHLCICKQVSCIRPATIQVFSQLATGLDIKAMLWWLAEAAMQLGMSLKETVSCRVVPETSANVHRSVLFCCYHLHTPAQRGRDTSQMRHHCLVGCTNFRLLKHLPDIVRLFCQDLSVKTHKQSGRTCKTYAKPSTI